MSKGYVYVLTNPSFKHDWVKIGRSSRMPEIRSKELYNTSIPLPFEIYATLSTKKYIEAENLIHKSIDRLSDLRINKSREFFNIAPELAYEILLDVSRLLDDAVVELYGDNIEVNGAIKDRKKRSKLFNFYEIGIEKGEVINFINNENIKAVVIDSRKVLYEGEEFYLSGLVLKLFTEMGSVNPSGAYQGPAYFLYKGQRLVDMPTIIWLFSKEGRARPFLLLKVKVRNIK